MASKDHKYYSFASVTSKALVPIYAESFGIDEEQVMPLGLPRSDLFFNEEKIRLKKQELYEEYPFLQGKKIILFAPTFRGGTRKSAHYPFEYLNFEKLYESLKDDYIFLIKVHFNTLNKINIPFKYKDFLYDFSFYRDINDLFLVSDIMITDYSSVCFEFALLDRPMLFFAPDVEEYISTRGFYYEFNKLVPGKIVKSTVDLCEAIHNQDFEYEKVQPFKDYFFEYQDGNAAKRIIKTFMIDHYNPEEIK